MRLTRSVFSKYRKLDNTSIELRDITIFIGENNSGKSTILEGIYGAFFSNSEDQSRYFSKVLKEDSSVSVFFKIEEQDLHYVLGDLGLNPSKKDSLLVHHEFQLVCKYNYSSKDIDRKIVVDRLRERYDDDLRLDSITNRLNSLFRQKIVLIRPNEELPSESLRPMETISIKREEFPLNHLYYLQNKNPEQFESLNDIISSLFGDTKMR
jgi:predicted ATP-dependent endonuclease of OLD family